MAARARNTLRRPLRIIGVSATAFIVVLLTLILIPREATRAAARLLEGTRDRPDTVVLAGRVDHLEMQTVAAESVLVRHRARAHSNARRAVPADSLRPLAARDGAAAQRDSLAADANELTRLLALTVRSPLPSSYRALGGARALIADRRARMLLDSLSDVASARDAIAANSAIDPVFLALTARLTAIGHRMQALAAAKNAAVRAELAALAPSVPRPSPISASVDTIRDRARLDSVRRIWAVTTTALDRARRLDSALDARTEEARDVAGASAPPLALMTAALVLGIAVGFAVTFGFELRTPRISDAAEAARIAGVPTLVTVVPRTLDPQQMRRSTDRDLSPLLDVNSESYRYVYLTVSGGDAAEALGFPLVAVTGDEAEVVATVAANIAVASVHDSRTTLLIDSDVEAGAIAGIVGVARAPGVADVLAGRSDWAQIIASAVIGRERSLSVMPAGTQSRTATARLGATRPSEPATTPGPDAFAGGDAEDGGTPTVDAAELRAELIRLGRRYDLIVVAAPAGAAQLGPASIVPVRDVIICVRVAYTPLVRLARAIETLRESQLRVRGVVLWDADVPPRLTGA